MIVTSSRGGRFYLTTRLAGAGTLVALVLTLSGCSGPSDADAMVALAERNLASIKLTRTGAGKWMYTATKDGVPCSGSITMSGSASSRVTSVTESCGAVEPVPVVKPTCSKANPEVCRDDAASKLKAKKGKEALALLAVACDEASNAEACNDWGHALDNGTGGLEVDAKRAQELFEKACDLKSAHGCANRGLGHAAAKELDKAFALFGKACELGGGSGCYHLGWALRRGEGTKKDDAKAVESFDKGCAKGYANACGAKGLLIAQGQGAPKDAVLGEKLLVEACEKEAGDACSNLGHLILDGKLGPSDPVRALGLFEKACAFEFGSGCFSAGVAYDAGKGTTKSLEKGEELYTKACGFGAEDGCYNSGINHRDGTGTAKDPEKARELFDKACTMGAKKACTERDRIKL